MKIEILGSGCLKCKMLTENASKAVKEAGIDAEIVKVTEIEEIVKMGVMMTPALAVDGEVRSAGKVLTKDQIIDILNGGGKTSGCSGCSGSGEVSGSCCCS